MKNVEPLGNDQLVSTGVPRGLTVVPSKTRVKLSKDHELVVALSTKIKPFMTSIEMNLTVVVHAIGVKYGGLDQVAGHIDATSITDR